jgi:acetyl-CoA synthetase
MIPEAAVAMLACARIGAVHSIVFGGFSPESLASRIQDCASKLVITADEGLRGGKKVPLKANVDAALAQHPLPRREGRRREAHRRQRRLGRRPRREVRGADGRGLGRLPADAGGRGRPAVHPLHVRLDRQAEGRAAHHGRLSRVRVDTFEHVFDWREDDVFWCTADVGWVTGHSYVVYGPLRGATTLMFEGVPNYPDAGRCWQVCDKHRRDDLLHGADRDPRADARGRGWVTKHSRQSIRLLGSVGEPINPEAWEWYHRVVGERRCPVVDTWWQTETGGILITPLPGATALKPGSATTRSSACNPRSSTAPARCSRARARATSCCSTAGPARCARCTATTSASSTRTSARSRARTSPGDGARRDEDGYYWITGRVDDVINVSGHRLGTAEVESALVAHPAVAEAAVVGYPHDIKGQGIYAYVTLKAGHEPSDKLLGELKQTVRKQIGAIASPDVIQWAPGLPKTRSGKIMRRILRKIAANESDQLGDVSTLADPSVVKQLVDHRPRG